MGFSGLSALLGLSGGANAVGGSLAELATTKRAEDQKRQQTVLQLMLAGYQPAPTNVTPTAQGNPLAQNSYAHFTDQGQALASLVTPRQMDVPGVGAFQETPGAALKRALGIQKIQADLAHVNAETDRNRRETAKPQLGDANFAKLSGEVKGAEAAAEVTPHVRQAVQIADQTPDKPQVSVQTPADPSQPAVATVITPHGTHAPSVATTPIPGTTKSKDANQAGSAPMAARVGQMGLALRAAGKLIPMHEQLGTSGIPLGAQTAAETAGGGNVASHLPGAKEFSNIVLAGSGDYAVYKAGLPNLILGATHAISGARINQQQADLLASGLELRQGDEQNPAIGSKKLDDMVDFLNSMRASLPADAVAKEEAGIDAQTMAVLKQHGYGNAPNGTAFGLIQQVVPSFKPGQPSAASPSHVPTYEEWKKSQGIP